MSTQQRDQELEERIRRAQKDASDAQGTLRDWWTPTPDREVHFRILAFPGHKECWIDFKTHYVSGPNGRRQVRCNGSADDCYTCNKVKELLGTGNKEDAEIAKDSRATPKVIMQIVNLDNPSAGPQLWEPKSTRACPQWTNILSILLNPDYFKSTYEMSEGRIITMLVHVDKQTVYGSMKDVMSLKSMIPGTSKYPIPYKTVQREGRTAHLIQLTMKDGSKRVFEMIDLAEYELKYDEAEHRKVWGDRPAEESFEQQEGEGFPETQEPSFAEPGTSAQVEEFGTEFEQPQQLTSRPVQGKSVPRPAVKPAQKPVQKPF